jgi:hypothetical protein
MAETSIHYPTTINRFWITLKKRKKSTYDFGYDESISQNLNCA